MVPATSRLICDPVQSQATPVCVTSSGPSSLGSRRLESTLGIQGSVCLSSSLPDSPGNLQDDGSGLSQNHSHCSRVAKHALVLGPGELVGSDSLQSAIAKGPGDSTCQWSSSQEPQQSQSACLGPRVSAIRKQGFSDEVAARIEAQPEPSTSQSGPFLSNGVSHTRWTSGRLL